jgi:hypothetical protein
MACVKRAKKNSCLENLILLPTRNTYVLLFLGNFKPFKEKGVMRKRNVDASNKSALFFHLFQHNLIDEINAGDWATSLKTLSPSSGLW